MNGDSEKWDLNTLLIQSVERDIKYSNHTNTIHILNIITLFHYSIRINTKEMWISDKMTLQFSKLIFTCSISIYTHYKQQLTLQKCFHIHTSFVQIDSIVQYKKEWNHQRNWIQLNSINTIITTLRNTFQSLDSLKLILRLEQKQPNIIDFIW